MQQITRTVTSKGQVTIPKQIRDQLGIDVDDRVTFVIHESGTVEIRPLKYSVRDLRGILPAIPGRETEDFEDFIDEALQVRADQLASGISEWYSSMRMSACAISPVPTIPLPGRWSAWRHVSFTRSNAGS